MLHVSVTAGLRVSELVGLRLDEVAFESRYLNLHVRGKGRKNRLLTLWKAVAASVRAWLAVRGEAIVPELFLNARGKEMTRAGFEYLLQKHATAASEYCPSLRDKRISPHVLRHTCALNILQATGDIRKVALWLGHESIQTTEDYLRVDVTQRIGSPRIGDTTPATTGEVPPIRPADRVAQGLNNMWSRPPNSPLPQEPDIPR